MYNKLALIKNKEKLHLSKEEANNYVIEALKYFIDGEDFQIEVINSREPIKYLVNYTKSYGEAKGRIKFWLKRMDFIRLLKFAFTFKNYNVTYIDIIAKDEEIRYNIYYKLLSWEKEYSRVRR